MSLATPLRFSIAVLICGVSAAQHGAEDGEWPSYGGGTGSTKYSPLDQIDASNFGDLELQWTWVSADNFLSKSTPIGEWRANSDFLFDDIQGEQPDLWQYGRNPRIADMKATPLMVDGVLYLCTPLSVAAAVDARTGETLWTFDPKSYLAGTPTGNLTWTHRGVAFWQDDGNGRILWGTGDYYLYAVDAKTGRPCADFGEGGRVDLMDGLPRIVRGEKDAFFNQFPIAVKSPPIVVGDTVIVGSSIHDRKYTRETFPGWVRAFDTRTGDHRWNFHGVPQEGEFGTETWENDSWKISGNANVWSMMSADLELGYVYLPVGSGAYDYYGGYRHGDNLYSQSLVCLDAATGERVWHFQMVHHGIWDYDPPAAPNLIDITVDGTRRKAVAQITKQGFVFVFDRVTGEPIWPIEERRVPTTSNMVGDAYSPTQPFPTKPAPFEPQGVSIDDLVDFTPALRAEAVAAVEGHVLGPLYTPHVARDESAGIKETIMRPGMGGGANWHGAGVDPETGLLYVPSRSTHAVIPFVKPDPATGADLPYAHTLNRGGPRLASGIPLFKPPYTRITAIDLNTGEHRWVAPVGDGDAIRNHDALKHLDLPPLGGDGFHGVVVTKTLLISAVDTGGTNDGPRLVAWDKATGSILASIDLPRRGLGTPMTYMLDGKQYVALTISGIPPKMVAYSLPGP